MLYIKVQNNCRFGDQCRGINSWCNKNHNNTNNSSFLKDCKFGEMCRYKKKCRYKHPSKCIVKCVNGFNCNKKNMECKWLHVSENKKCIAGNECKTQNYCERNYNRTHNHPRIFINKQCKFGENCKAFIDHPANCSWAHGDKALKTLYGMGIDKDINELQDITCPLIEQCIENKYCPYKH